MPSTPSTGRSGCRQALRPMMRCEPSNRLWPHDLIRTALPRRRAREPNTRPLPPSRRETRTASRIMVEVCRVLVLEENQVESAETRGIGEHVDLDDLAALYTEAEGDARPSARGPHGFGASVDERRSRKPGAPREGVGYGRRASHLPGAPVRAAASSARSTTSGSSSVSS